LSGWTGSFNQNTSGPTNVSGAVVNVARSTAPSQNKAALQAVVYLKFAVTLQLSFLWLLEGNVAEIRLHNQFR
jgi:hypothetical protein